MQGNWQNVTLEECMDVIIDYRGKTPRKTTSGIPLVTAKIIKGGQISPVQEYISNENYDTWMRRGIPKSGDVVMTTEAPLGEVAQLDDRKVALAQRVITLRGKKDFLDNTFLKYLIQSPFVQGQLNARATGTTVIGIKQKELRKVILLIPPYIEQNAIAHILGTLDDKIELNSQMNETLEEITGAIFKSWFMDFDPTRAKAEGHDTGLPQQIADLFPDNFESTEIGEIPMGWSVGNVSDLLTIHKNPLNPKDYPEETFEYYSIPAFDNGKEPEHVLGETIKSNKYIISKQGCLISKLNPRIPRVWLPYPSTENRAVCSTEFLVCEPKNDVSREYIYSFFCSETFQRVFGTLVTGTSGSHQRVKPDYLLDMKTLIPDKTVVIKFTEIIQSFFDRVANNLVENQTLSASRDTLIPKLLSGELRIPDPEKFEEGANGQT